MAFHCTLGKCIIATVLVGGGVTGAVLGSTSAKEISKFPISRQVTHPEEQGGRLGTKEVQEPSSFVEPLASEDSGQVKQKKEDPQLAQSSNQLVIGTELKSQESGIQLSAEVGPSSIEDKSSEFSVSSQGDSISSSEKNSTFPANHNLDAPTPKLPVDEPTLEDQIPFEREEDFDEPTEDEEEDKDWTKENWFVTKWSVSDNDLDGSAWTYRECTPNISGGDLTLECAWNGEDSQMVELHLHLSSDEDLKGKNWADLVEITFSGKVGKLATLDLTFSDDPDKAIQVFIYRRNNV